jgi:hypothetical protein
LVLLRNISQLSLDLFMEGSLVLLRNISQLSTVLFMGVSLVLLRKYPNSDWTSGSHLALFKRI